MSNLSGPSGAKPSILSERCGARGVPRTLRRQRTARLASTSFILGGPQPRPTAKGSRRSLSAKNPSVPAYLPPSLLINHHLSEHTFHALHLLLLSSQALWQMTNVHPYPPSTRTFSSSLWATAAAPLPRPLPIKRDSSFRTLSSASKPTEKPYVAHIETGKSLAAPARACASALLFL